MAGHGGLVGSAVVQRLQREGYTNILTATRQQLDLRDQAAVNVEIHSENVDSRMSCCATMASTGFQWRSSHELAQPL